MIRINIALDPPAALSRNAITLSRRLAKVGGAEFILDGTHIYPHVTLVMGYAEEHQLESIIGAVRRIAADSPVIQLRPAGAYASRGFLGLNMYKIPELMQLQKRTEERLSAFFSALTKEESYRPHLTLLKSRNARVKAPMLSMPNFVCSRITVFEAGKFGTCIRRLATFQLAMP